MMIYVYFILQIFVFFNSFFFPVVLYSLSYLFLRLIFYGDCVIDNIVLLSLPLYWIFALYYFINFIISYMTEDSDSSVDNRNANVSYLQ